MNMENSQGNSFIPKSPVRGTVKPYDVRKVYIFTYITFVFFFGALIATAGTFFYDITIDRQLESQKSRLAEERNSFNQADLERVRELEKRMTTAYSILDRHVSVHSILSALEESTLRSVQIDSFEYMKDVDNSLNLALIARTTNFNAALFQREIFSGNSVLAGGSISKIELSDEQSLDDTSDTAGKEVIFRIEKSLSSLNIPYVPNAYTPVVVNSFDDTETFSIDDLNDGLAGAEDFESDDTSQ